MREGNVDELDTTMSFESFEEFSFALTDFSPLVFASPLPLPLPLPLPSPLLSSSFPQKNRLFADEAIRRPFPDMPACGAIPREWRLINLTARSILMVIVRYLMSYWL